MSRRKSITALTVILVAVLLVAAGCGSQVVARINGEKVLKSELERKTEELKSGIAQQGVDFESEQGKEVMKKVEQEAVQQLINEKLIMQQAKKKGVEVDKNKIDEQMDQMKERFGQEQFDKLLQDQNLTEEYLRRQLKIQLTAEALFNEVTKDLSVEEEDAKEFFEENKQSLAEVKAAHILIGVSADAPEEQQQAAKAKAEGLIEELESGVDFASLAQEHSQDAQSAQNGGVLDMYFTRNDPYLMKEFTQAAFELPEGEFSKQPAKTSYGYHIIKVMDKKDTYDELKKSVETRLLSEKKNKEFTEYFTEVKNNAEIENMLAK